MYAHAGEGAHHHEQNSNACAYIYTCTYIRTHYIHMHMYMHTHTHICTHRRDLSSSSATEIRMHYFDKVNGTWRAICNSKVPTVAEQTSTDSVPTVCMYMYIYTYPCAHTHNTYHTRRPSSTELSSTLLYVYICTHVYISIYMYMHIYPCAHTHNTYHTRRPSSTQLPSTPLQGANSRVTAAARAVSLPSWRFPPLHATRQHQPRNPARLAWVTGKSRGSWLVACVERCWSAWWCIWGWMYGKRLEDTRTCIMTPRVYVCMSVTMLIGMMVYMGWNAR
jgi:hypothetical protein